MTIAEKVAYLKGLAEGLDVTAESSKEGKLINMMMDILQDIALELEDLAVEQEELGEEIDAISGATLTTDGYKKAILRAFACVKIFEGGNPS